jgi:hypothetical protein
MSFWIVAMFWWSVPGGREGSPSHYAPRDLSEFHIPYPVRYYETDTACLADIPKRRGLNGYTCIRLRLEEVSQQPPIAP